jgi:broad-specificity NMP kinase
MTTLIYGKHGKGKTTMSQDLDNHPCQIAYDAGVKFAHRRPNVSDADVRRESHKYDDEENFQTGYYNTINK